MENKRKNFNENLQDLIEFCKRENRLPNDIYGKEEGRLKGFIGRYKDDPRIIGIKERYLRNKSFDENLQDLIEYCKRNGKLPHSGSEKEGSRLNGFMEKYKDDPRIIEIREKYSMKGKSFDENLQDLIEFCEREGKLPRDSKKDGESRLKGFINNHRYDPRIIEVKKKYTIVRSFDENLQDLIEFCKRENSLPHDRFGKEGGRLKGFMKRYKKDPRIIEIREYYRRSFGKGISKFEEGLKDLIEFCKKENRLPQPGFGKEEGRLSAFIYRYIDDLRVIEIKEEYSKKGKSFDENLQDLIEFCKRENRLPHSGGEKEEDIRLGGFIYTYRNDPKVKIIKKKYGKKGGA